MSEFAKLVVDLLVFQFRVVCICTAAVIIFFTVAATIEHFTPHPTADELYGCTIQQQAPNGECK